MDHIRRLAWISIARGCGFGTLAIFTLMIGYVTTPGLALDFGGLGFLLMACILIAKAERSDRFPHHRTEIWLMLAPEERPPPEVAPVLINRSRREAMLHFALISAVAATVCLAIAAAIQLAGYH